MKITVIRAALLPALKEAARFASTKNAIPVLGCVHIRAEDGEIRLAGTDLELGVTLPVPGDIQQHGEILVPAARFLAYIEALPEGYIELEADDQLRLAVRTPGKGPRATFGGLDPQQFPSEPSPTDDAPRISIPVEDLLAFRSRVAYCASHDNARPYLCFVNIARDGDGLLAQATDGAQLAFLRRKIEVLPNVAFDLNPALLRRAAWPEEGEIEITLTSGYIIAMAGSTRWNARRNDGTFPNLSRLMPTQFPIQSRVSRSEMTEAIKRAARFDSSKAPEGIKLEVTRDRITVSIRVFILDEGAPGSFSETIDAQTETEGTRPLPLIIRFNQYYLSKALAAIPSSVASITLRFVDPKNLMLIDVSEDQAAHALLPLINI